MKLFARNLNNVAFAGVMSSLLACGGQAPDATGTTNGALTAPGNSFTSFDTCLASIPTPRTVADAVACVPSGCHVTWTLSEESAQSACTLRDGTRLPRVIFSCAGAIAQDQRFRPSFSLCTMGGVINHIEIGEDVNKKTGSDDPEVAAFPFVQKMADVDTKVSFQVVADTPTKNLGCAECHDRKGTWPPGTNDFNLFGPIRPELADGTIFTNDPAVVAPAPANQIPPSVICAGINSIRFPLANSLCSALAAKSH